MPPGSGAHTHSGTESLIRPPSKGSSCRLISPYLRALPPPRRPSTVAKGADHRHKGTVQTNHDPSPTFTLPKSLFDAEADTMASGRKQTSKKTKRKPAAAAPAAASTAPTALATLAPAPLSPTSASSGTSLRRPRRVAAEVPDQAVQAWTAAFGAEL